MKVVVIILSVLACQGYAALVYTQPPATCDVMRGYSSSVNTMKFSACIIAAADSAQCTLTCTNNMQGPISSMKVAVLPGCDSQGNGIQITVGNSAGQTYSNKFYNNGTATPSFLSPSALVVTVVQESPVHVGFQLQLSERNSATNAMETNPVLPYRVIPTDSTYFNCPVKNSRTQDQTCPSLDDIVNFGPYSQLGNCRKNTLCSSLRCGVTTANPAIQFASFTFFPCSVPPTVNIVVATSQGAEINQNLTLSNNISFVTTSLGTLKARIGHPNESYVGFGIDITRPDGTITTTLPYSLIPLTISTCQAATPAPTQPPVADDIRLTGGKNYLSGRVEIKINNTWGTICDFNNRFQYNTNAANFVCRQLQLGAGQVIRSGQASILGYSNDDNLPIFLSNLSCPVYFDSRKIQSYCNYLSPPLVNCTGAMNVAVECSTCSGYLCDEGTCAKPCDGVRECNNGADESALVCFFTKGLSTNAKIAIGVVVGLIFLVVVAIGITVGILYCTGVIGGGSRSGSQSPKVSATSYKPGPEKYKQFS